MKTPLTLCALCLLMLQAPASAQTPLVELKDSTAALLLQINDDAGLLTLGTFGTGTIPATGAGTRMLWYPAKGAFRAGHVTSSHWNDANIGDYSVALGYNTTASGERSTALGFGTTASGSQSTALGATTWASGESSLAAGWSTTASGANSTALGSGTEAVGLHSTALGLNGQATGFTSTVMGSGTVASGDFSVAMGLNTKAYGVNSTATGYQSIASGMIATALGRETVASGFASTAMGASTTASGTRSTAMGYLTTANGDYATAMGYQSTASSDYATAMGYNTSASDAYATAMGRETVASGFSSVAMGESTTASGLNSTAIGLRTTASGYYSTAMGAGTTAQAFMSLVIGQTNIVSGNSAQWISTDPLFVAGNGYFNSPSNALTLLKNGDLTIAGTLTQSSDARLKEDLAPLTGVLEALETIEPVYFRFREGTHRSRTRHIGLLAQQVQAVFPELVSTESDGYLSVSYANLSAVLMQAVKEQQAEIDALRDRLARLEAILLEHDPVSPAER